MCRMCVAIWAEGEAKIVFFTRSLSILDRKNLNVDFSFSFYLYFLLFFTLIHIIDCIFSLSFKDFNNLYF